jgi:hypothetical protein
VRQPAALRLLGIHQHEQNAAGLRAAIDPGVIGSLLDDDIACLVTFGKNW